MGRQHVLYALDNAETFDVDARGVYTWLAPDDRGVLLEIMGRKAVEDPDKMVIFHVFPRNLKKGGYENDI
jgi:hypothetical protein